MTRQDAPDAAKRGFIDGFAAIFFHGADDAQAVIQGVNTVFSNTRWPGRFCSDNLIAWGRALSFLDDTAFMAAFRRFASRPDEKGVIWRTHTLAWALRTALRLPDGDLVECGAYRGTTARILAELARDEIGSRQYWLYDAFEWRTGDRHDWLPGHSGDLLSEVRQKFDDVPFARIVPGYMPESFADGAPENVALLHLDLNNVEGEEAAMRFFWDRLVPGALVVLDDFGWCAYDVQRQWHERFAAEQGCAILELPTGQGLLIKNA